MLLAFTSLFCADARLVDLAAMIDPVLILANGKCKPDGVQCFQEHECCSACVHTSIPGIRQCGNPRISSSSSSSSSSDFLEEDSLDELIEPVLAEPFLANGKCTPNRRLCNSNGECCSRYCKHSAFGPGGPRLCGTWHISSSSSSDSLDPFPGGIDDSEESMRHPSSSSSTSSGLEDSVDGEASLATCDCFPFCGPEDPCNPNCYSNCMGNCQGVGCDGACEETCDSQELEDPRNSLVEAANSYKLSSAQDGRKRTRNIQDLIPRLL